MGILPDTVLYLACWTEDDGIYWCGHNHQTVADAMSCLVPDGRSFLRARESGVLRSLNDREFLAFLAELQSVAGKSSAGSTVNGTENR